MSRGLTRPFQYLPPADYKLFLETLREDRCLEYPIVGYDAIAQWFVKMKYTRTPWSSESLLRHRRNFGLPITKTPRTPYDDHLVPWTSNLMLHAWIATQGRAMSLPRYHPFRQAVEKTKPLSMHPRAIRGRNYRDRQRLAEAYALGSGKLDVGSSAQRTVP
jgi:hypothetical protein